MDKAALLAALASGALLQHGSAGWSLLLDAAASVRVAAPTARAVLDQLAQLPAGLRDQTTTYCLLSGKWTPLTVRHWRYAGGETVDYTAVATSCGGWAAYWPKKYTPGWGWELFRVGPPDDQGVHDYAGFLAVPETANAARLALAYLLDKSPLDWTALRQELREMRILSPQGLSADVMQQFRAEGEARLRAGFRLE